MGVSAGVELDRGDAEVGGAVDLPAVGVDEERGPHIRRPQGEDRRLPGKRVGTASVIDRTSHASSFSSAGGFRPRPPAGQDPPVPSSLTVARTVHEIRTLLETGQFKGNEEQREQFIRPTLTGEMICEPPFAPPR